MRFGCHVLPRRLAQLIVIRAQALLLALLLAVDNQRVFSCTPGCVLCSHITCACLMF